MSLGKKTIQGIKNEIGGKVWIHGHLIGLIFYCLVTIGLLHKKGM